MVASALTTLSIESCSKDPIGYVDGYNLFAAYFVPSKLDPSGEGLDSITGSIEACLKLPNPAARIKCLNDLITPETAPHIKPHLKVQEALRDELLKRTIFLRRCFNTKLNPLKTCTPKGKEWLEWYRTVAQAALDKYKTMPKTPGVVRGIAEQERRLKVIDDLLKSCGL